MQHAGWQHYLILKWCTCNYLLLHACGLLTNEGFTFNEGWAELWAGQCNDGPFGDSPTNYRYKGNVAHALRSLQSQCASSDGQMVDILWSSMGQIHSFDEYVPAHQTLYGCPATEHWDKHNYVAVLYTQHADHGSKDVPVVWSRTIPEHFTSDRRLIIN